MMIWLLQISENFLTHNKKLVYNIVMFILIYFNFYGIFLVIYTAMPRWGSWHANQTCPRRSTTQMKQTVSTTTLLGGWRKSTTLRGKTRLVTLCTLIDWKLKFPSFWHRLGTITVGLFSTLTSQRAEWVILY